MYDCTLYCLQKDIQIWLKYEREYKKCNEWETTCLQNMKDFSTKWERQKVSIFQSKHKDNLRVINCLLSVW